MHVKRRFSSSRPWPASKCRSRRLLIEMVVEVAESANVEAVVHFASRPMLRKHQAEELLREHAQNGERKSKTLEKTSCCRIRFLV